MTKEIDDRKNQLIQNLIRIGAVKFGDFVLSSGVHSNYYVDVKQATCSTWILCDIVKLVKMKIDDAWLKTAEPPCVGMWAGVELGGISLAVALSLETGYNHLIVRKQEKAHGSGKGKLVEGIWRGGETTAVLIEDVTTTGASTVKAIHALEKEGIRTTAIISVVDREQGAREVFTPFNIPFLPLITATELLGAGP